MQPPEQVGKWGKMWKAVEHQAANPKKTVTQIWFTPLSTPMKQARKKKNAKESEMLRNNQNSKGSSLFSSQQRDCDVGHGSISDTLSSDPEPTSAVLWALTFDPYNLKWHRSIQEFPASVPLTGSKDNSAAPSARSSTRLRQGTCRAKTI